MFDWVVFPTVTPHSASGLHVVVGSAYTWECEPVVAAIAAPVAAHCFLYRDEEG